MHIGVVGPINVDDLADLLPDQAGAVARAQPRGNGTAPGAIVRGHHARGHHVSVVTRTQGCGPLTLRGERVDIIRVDGRAGRLRDTASRWHGAVADMTAALHTLSPDVVHANWAYEGALAGARSGLPLVVTARDAPLTVVRYYPRPDRWVRLTMPYELRARHASRAMVTAVSPYLARAWTRQTRWPGEVSLVPNIAPAIQRHPVDDASPPRFVEVADDGRRKNVPTLLKAFAVVRARRADACLTLVGSGLGATGRLAAWARTANLDAGVDFVGVLDAAGVRHRLAGAVAHVHLAREETFGNTLVEAMSLGTPVVAGARSGSVPWVLGDGYAADLVDVEDAADVARQMLAVLTDPAHRERLVVAGLHEVATRFGGPQVCESYEGVYHRAVERRRA